jgi:hypothetical protein
MPEVTLSKHLFACFVAAILLTACAAGSNPPQAIGADSPGISTDHRRADSVIIQPKHVILDLPGRTTIYVSGLGAKIQSDGCSGLVANVNARPRKNGPSGNAYVVRAIATGKCKVFFSGDDSSKGVLTVKVK